jgi:hypothetical protein
MIATEKTSEYDRAVALLRELRALAECQGEVGAEANPVTNYCVAWRKPRMAASHAWESSN